MPIVRFKNGNIFQVPIESLEDFLLDNQDKIQVMKVKRRGPLRTKR